MPQPLVSPNFHVIFIHLPLGVFVLGVLMELFSCCWPRSGARAAGRWMIVLGALAMAPAATTGIYALSDVAHRMLPAGASPDDPWKTVVATTQINPEQWRLLRMHVILQSSAAALGLFVVVIGIGLSDRGREKFRLLLLLLLLIDVGGTIAGAWYGGEMVYREAVAVRLPPDAPAAPVADPATQPRKPRLTVEYFVPPLQTHVVFAGLSVALAAAALGLSLRKMSTLDGDLAESHLEPEDWTAPRTVPPAGPVIAEPLASEPSSHPMGEIPLAPDRAGPHPQFAPSPAAVPNAIESSRPALPGRFWLLTALVLLVTALLGYWMLTHDAGSWDPKAFWATVLNNSDHFAWTRRMAHLVGGGTLVIASLILAALARWAPRQKLLLTLFALVVVLAIALQVWLGILLTYDTEVGPLNRFRVAMPTVIDGGK